MDCSEVLANHTKTYVEVMIAEIYRDVTAKFCADNKMENPYLSHKEIDALKFIKTSDLPYDLIIPNTDLTIYGHYIGSDFIRDCMDSDKEFLNSQIVKVLYLVDSQYSFEYPPITQYADIAIYQDTYHLLGPYNSDCGKYLFFIMHPKNTAQMLSRYFIEFCNAENVNPKYLPNLVKYDLYIQKRMGFTNTNKLSESNEDKKLKLKLRKIEEREITADKYFESAQMYRERMNEREIKLTERVSKVKGELVDICGELLAYEDNPKKLFDIKRKIMDVYANMELQ
jgi:hypothetical protein